MRNSVLSRYTNTQMSPCLIAGIKWNIWKNKYDGGGGVRNLPPPEAFFSSVLWARFEHSFFSFNLDYDSATFCNMKVYLRLQLPTIFNIKNAFFRGSMGLISTGIGALNLVNNCLTDFNSRVLPGSTFLYWVLWTLFQRRLAHLTWFSIEVQILVKPITARKRILISGSMCPITTRFGSVRLEFDYSGACAAPTVP